MTNSTESFIGEETCLRKTKCRFCSNYLNKGEIRVATEYDPYTYTTTKHTFMNYYHPTCWEKKKAQKRNGLIILNEQFGFSLSLSS